MIQVGVHAVLDRGEPIRIRLQRTMSGRTAVVDEDGKFIGLVASDTVDQLDAHVDIEIIRDGRKSKAFGKMTIRRAMV
jgi:hypothetical protein